MTTAHLQSADIFTDAAPGIEFDTADETWTISPEALVSSSAASAVFSRLADSALFNQGSIFSTSQREAAVDYTGEGGLISNAAGARIIGADDGVRVDNRSQTIDNHGSIEGLAAVGVELDSTADQSTLSNEGAIFGRAAGVEIFASGRGSIHNLGVIASDSVGIDIEAPPGATVLVTNARGAMISGSDDAILVDQGGLFLDNRGTLTGDISMTHSADAATIINHGMIDGPVILGNRDDTFLGTGGTVLAVFGNDGSDRLTGGARADQLFGDGGNDRLVGAAGNDILGGGSGFDTLTGGPGRDQFVFETGLDPLHNVDRITDFAPHIDKIFLGDDIFQHLGHDGTLSAARFLIGAAGGPGAHIIYNPSNGFLLYDSDGPGGAGAEHFATLNPHLALHSTDFVLTHLLFEE